MAMLCMWLAVVVLFMHTSQQRLKGRYKSRRWEIKSSDFFSFYLINEYSCMTTCSSDPSPNTSKILMVKKISRTNYKCTQYLEMFCFTLIFNVSIVKLCRYWGGSGWSVIQSPLCVLCCLYTRGKDGLNLCIICDFDMNTLNSTNFYL